MLGVSIRGPVSSAEPVAASSSQNASVPTATTRADCASWTSAGDTEPSMIINTYYFRCEATYCKNGGQGFRQEAGACVCRCLQVEGNTN